MTDAPDNSSARPIFVTGATGFVGERIVNELLSRGHRVRALVREKPIDRDGVESVVGDLFDDAALNAGLKDCAGVIHLVGIIREVPEKGQTFEHIHYDGAVRVINAAKRNNVRRFIHMSALGVRENSASAYASTKARAEAYLKQSGLDWTILRPSIIHGKRSEFMRMLTGWATGKDMPYFFMPYFGRGVFGFDPAKLQPIHVDDVARAFVDALERPDLIGQTLDLAGPEQFTWPQVYDIASTLITGKPKLALTFPIWYARLITQIAPASWLPFNRSQVEMAGEDNTAPIDVVEKHFGWRPRDFAASLREYADGLNESKPGA